MLRRSLITPGTIAILLLALVGALLAILLFTSIDAQAHTPTDMSLEYDYDSRTLNVTITHEVTDDPEHFIEKVKIIRNGEDALEQKYDSQPSEVPFTYSYTIDAAEGDELEVVAECNVNGEITRQITVHGEDRHMDLSSSPSLTELEEGSDQVFTITIESEGNPVEVVDLTPVPSLGTYTTPVEEEPGSYTFTFTAPRVLTDTSVWINLTGTKNGYQDGNLSIQFTLTDIPGSNVILIGHAPDPASQDEGTQQQFTLDLEADTLLLEGAVLDIQAENGIVSGIVEEAGGVYTFMYQAPLVAGNQSISLTINASKDGYGNGSALIVVMIVNIPEPLAIHITTANATMETGTDQTITLYLDSNAVGVEGVSVILNSQFGSVSEVFDAGEGNYTFTYSAPDVIAETSIVINITATKEGFAKAYEEIPITVFIIPPEPINLLCVMLISETDPIPEATTVNITIYVLYDCDPFQGAEVEMTHLYGAVSTIRDEGNGKFTFSYLAPDIESDSLENFTITGKKADYGELTRTFNITIRASDTNGTRAGGDKDQLIPGVGEDNGLPLGDDGDPLNGQESEVTREPVDDGIGGHFLVVIASAGSIVLLLICLGLHNRYRKRPSD